MLCLCTWVASLQEAIYKPLISSMACSALGQADTPGSFPGLQQPVLVLRSQGGLHCSLPPCTKGQGRLFTPDGDHKKSDSQHYKYIVYKTYLKINVFLMNYFLQADKQGRFAMPVLSLACLKVLNSLPIMGITGPVILILV